jgi:nucleotide-binding universal stress UspA family protein
MATLHAKREERPMGGSVICGVDGSVDSQAALGVAVELATRLRLTLVLANVVEPSHETYAGTASLGRAVSRPLLQTNDHQVEAADARLEELAEMMGLERAKRRVVVGYAAERLADVADEEGAELIVVGSRGRGAFRAAFLGSVSTSLIGVARCPVLVVPPGAADIRPISSTSEATAQGREWGIAPIGSD